jgi:TRAP-type C4-dicarboxylate transport system permease small subunit
MNALKKLLGAGAAAALFLMMLLTFADVVGRKVLNASIVGNVELTELCMLGTIFIAMPLVSLAGEHVIFDLLDPMLPAPLRRWQRVISNVFCTLLVLGGAWLIHGRAARVFEDGDTTAQLQIPTGPFIQAASIMLLCTALMHLIVAIHAAKASTEAESESNVQRGA